MALLCSAAVQVAPLRLCFYLLFYLFLISLFAHITSALITYDKSTLLDIGNRFTNLVQDTLSPNPNPSWPLEILRNAENKGHRRRYKKHRGRSAGIRNRLRKRAHSPPLPSILLANVQSLDNKMDDLRARISFQRDIRDCNIICLTETWLTPSVPDTAVTPSDNFSVLRMDRQPRPVNPKAEECASWLTRNGVTPGISPLCRDPARLIWNIYPLSAAHSIYPASSPRSSLLPSTFHLRQTRAWLCLNFTMCSAASLTNILTLPLSSRGILTKPTSGRSCRTFTSMYPVQLEDRIHWIIATLSLKMPTRPALYRPSVNLTTPPFSSHRNTNKGSHRNPRWRGKWRVGPPTRKLCCRRLLMTSTGTCSGRAHLMSASSRMWQWAL